MTKLFSNLILLAGLLLLPAWDAVAGEVDFPTAYTPVFTNTVVSTNVATGTTNAPATTLYTNSVATMLPRWHTFQFFYSATGTNSCTQVLDSTIDGSNWLAEYTNAVVASGSNAQTTNEAAQFTSNTKKAAWRVRSTLLSTNATMTVNYMGQ